MLNQNENTLLNLLNNCNDYDNIRNLIELGVDHPYIDMDEMFAEVCMNYNYDSFRMMLDDYRIDPFDYQNRSLYYAISFGNIVFVKELISDHRFIPFTEDEKLHSNYLQYYFSINTNQQDMELVIILTKLFIDNDREFYAIKEIKKANLDYKFIINKACDLK